MTSAGGGVAEESIPDSSINSILRRLQQRAVVQSCLPSKTAHLLISAASTITRPSPAQPSHAAERISPSRGKRKNASESSGLGSTFNCGESGACASGRSCRPNVPEGRRPWPLPRSEPPSRPPRCDITGRQAINGAMRRCGVPQLRWKQR